MESNLLDLTNIKSGLRRVGPKSVIFYCNSLTLIDNIV